MQSSVNHLTADFNRNDSDGMHTLQSTIFGGFGFFFSTVQRAVCFNDRHNNSQDSCK